MLRTIKWKELGVLDELCSELAPFGLTVPDLARLEKCIERTYRNDGCAVPRFAPGDPVLTQQLLTSWVCTIL